MRNLFTWKGAFVGLVLVSIFGLVTAEDSCGGSNSSNTTQQHEANQASSQQDIYIKNQPVPTYTYSNERALLLQIYRMRIQGNVNTWTVWFDYYGHPLGSCESKGFPIPYSTELTNPSVVTRDGGFTGGAPGVVGQMDPNGLYPSQNSLGDWIVCLANDGKYYVLFVEPLVITYPYPVAIQNGVVVQTGNAPADSAVNPAAGK